jgi:hypothetical protein
MGTSSRVVRVMRVNARAHPKDKAPVRHGTPAPTAHQDGGAIS